jgi:UPF0716 protein FxsA
MRLLVVAVIIGLPLLDIASLIQVGAWIGVWPALAAVIAAFLAGSLLMRTQGFVILQQAQVTLEEGRFPAREVFDGACVLFGSMLLMFLGFVSDAFGITLLLPPVRSLLRRLIGAQVRRSGRFAVWTLRPDTGTPPSAGRSGPLIDGEYQPVDEPDDPSSRRDAADQCTPGTLQGKGSARSRPSSTAVVPPDDP